MKVLSYYAMIVLAAMFLSCSRDGAEGHDHSHGEAETEQHDSHNHGEHEGEDEHNEGNAAEAAGEIVFSPEKAKQFHIIVSTPKRGFSHVIKVSGQIEGAQGDQFTVVAKSAGVVRLRGSVMVGAHVSAGTSLASISAKALAGGDVNELNRVALANAKRELDRLRPLYQDKIVTAREYNAALAAYEQARAACSSGSSAGSSASSAISGTITEVLVNDGDYVDAGARIAVVSKNSRLVLRADLPTSYAREAQSITSAKFRTTYSDEVYSTLKLGGRRVTSAATSTTPGYIPVCFEFSNSANLVSGSFAEVYLCGATDAHALALPTAAITEELGKYYVYVQLDEECYMKRPVTIGNNDGEYVEVLSGITANDRVVTEGAMIIKMAATGGAVPGHSHEH